MSLDCNLSKIKDWQKVTIDRMESPPEGFETLEDFLASQKPSFPAPQWYWDDEKGGLHRTNAITFILTMGTMSIGLGKITLDNAEDVYQRYAMHRILYGPEFSGGVTLTRQMILDHVGLETNVHDTTQEEFSQDFSRRAEMVKEKK